MNDFLKGVLSAGINGLANGLHEANMQRWFEGQDWKVSRTRRGLLIDPSEETGFHQCVSVGLDDKHMFTAFRGLTPITIESREAAIFASSCMMHRLALCSWKIEGDENRMVLWAIMPNPGLTEELAVSIIREIVGMCHSTVQAAARLGYA